jgi:hypothetical protein
MNYSKKIILSPFDNNKFEILCENNIDIQKSINFFEQLKIQNSNIYAICLENNNNNDIKIICYNILLKYPNFMSLSDQEKADILANYNIIYNYF